MKNDTSEWEVPHYSVSSGRSTIGLELRVLLDRPLSDADRSIINAAMDGLRRDLLCESTRMHPDNVRWKADWLVSVRSTFAAAGLTPVYLREIDNEYCGPKCCPHRVWLLVTTAFGVVKIGWRKSVIVIDWSDSDVRAPSRELFPLEDVTQGERFIHAHGYVKAREYLTKIREAAG